MSRRIDWDRLKRSTVIAEALYFAFALVALASGWMSLPLVLLLVAVELVLMAALSKLFYPERGTFAHVLDVLKMLALCAFCAIFPLAAYFGAGGFSRGPVIDLAGIAALLVLGSARLLLVSVNARRSGDPRLFWTREAMMRGGVLAVSMFLFVFACFIPGLPLATLLAWAWPATGVDVALGAVLFLIQGALACVMSTMTDRELAEIAQRPYLD